MDRQRTRVDGSGMSTVCMRSLVDGDVGSSAARRSGGRLRWRELLKVENGGPGEVPGREEAVREAREVSEKKRRRREAGKVKGLRY